MVTSDDIIRQMNALVEGSIAEAGETVEQVLGEQIAERGVAADLVRPSKEPSEDPAREEFNEDSTNEPENLSDVPELAPAEDDESEDEAEDDEESESGEEEQEIPGQHPKE
jgi:hypothetical protein